jgi:hypothetical protein
MLSIWHPQGPFSVSALVGLGLSLCLCGDVFAGPGPSGPSVRPLDSMVKQRLLAPYKKCLARQEDLHRRRDPFCVALMTKEPARCAVLSGPSVGLCWWLTLGEPLGLMSLLGFRSAALDLAVERCPLELPPGIKIKEGLCRQITMSHLLQRNSGAETSVLLLALNPYIHPVTCKVRIRDMASESPWETLLLSLPAGSALDQRFPFRYDSKTELNLEWECEWSPAD